jgi:hypothetical protein
MSQENAWTLEEMARAMQAERLADAARYRMVTTVPGSYASPRTQLANALRSLATLLDGDAKARPQPDRRLVRAF